MCLMKREKIVLGSGYMGMSLLVLLAQHNDVTVLDLDAERVGDINYKCSYRIPKISFQSVRSL